MQQRQFVQNAATMTITALILRAIGIFFRIYLSARIGAEGMGLYQLIFSIYVLASTFASSGICTAVARLITDELVNGSAKSIRHIMRRATTLSVMIGALSAVVLYISAPAISAHWLKDIRAIPSLKILGIGLPFMGATSCLRGYFMARRKSLLPSLAQIAEQISRIALITTLLYIFADRGISYTCFAVIFGDCLAEIFSCFLMTAGYWTDYKQIRHLQISDKKRKGVLYRMLSISGPITAGRYLNSALRTIENILVPHKLTAHGGSAQNALAQFGMLKGMAMPLLFFPASFLTSLSTLLLPEISEAHTLGQTRKIQRAVCRTMKLTLVISFWLSGLFTVFAYDLGELLYSSQDVGFLLRVLAPLMPIMYLESIVDGILKGLNQQVSSLWYSVIDSSGRIALILCLVPLKGMEGFLWIMVFSNLLTCFLNVNRLLRVINIDMRWMEWLFKPILAISVPAGGIYLLNQTTYLQSLTQIVRLVVGALFITACFCLLAIGLGIITKKDLRNLRLRRSSYSNSAIDTSFSG